MRAVLAGVAGFLAVSAAACFEERTTDAPESLDELVQQVAEVRDLEPPADFEVLYLERSKLPELLDELITPADRELFAETTTLYRLLGYIDDDEDYFDIYRSFGAGAILGLYAPDRDTLWVIHADDDHGTFESLSRGQVETLAHEVVHALQDYHFKLDEDYYEVASDIDRALAWTAIIEGDATVHDQEFSDEYLSLPPGGGGPVMLLADGAQVRTASASSAVIRELYFPYTKGADAVDWIVEELGIEAVNEYLADPPAGTTLILHPDRIESGWQPQEVTLPDLTASLGDSWKRESVGTFGEFHLANYLHQERHADDAYPAADGWAGDHYDVYTDGRDAVAVFRVAFADADEAAEFRDEHAQFAEERADGATDARGGLLITPMGDGDVLVRSEGDGENVLFAIGSNETIAVRALQAVIAG